MQEQKTIIISVIGYGDVILLQRQNANILNVMMDMTEQKRYYEKNYEEQYYIFDSKTLTEKEFEKKVEYEGYDLFADSLTPKEVVDLLNENEELKKENNDLKTSNEYWREKCLSKDSYNKFHHKPTIWFTQSAKLTENEVEKVAKAIKQDLKKRRIKK